MAEHKDADASCWSPDANKAGKTPFRPECRVCGKPAIGGVLTKCHNEVYTIGFECGDHGTLFAITLANFSPNWVVSAKLSPGVYNLVRRRETTELPASR